MQYLTFHKILRRELNPASDNDNFFFILVCESFPHTSKYEPERVILDLLTNKMGTKMNHSGTQPVWSEERVLDRHMFTGQF